jgi:hypothetical protein
MQRAKRHTATITASDKSDITLDSVWQNRQTMRLLGYEVLRKAIEARHGKIPAYELADRTASDHHEAGRVFNHKFLPCLLQKLGREPNAQNIKAIRKFFNESSY